MMRVYCYPHAGGGASVYARWSARLPPAIQVHRPLLPGRESRFNEPMPRTLAVLTEALAAGVGADGAPYALFGHSFGGLVAFEVARALRRMGRPPPEVLVVSAVPAPQIPDTAPVLHELSGEAYLRELRRLGATEELLANRELLEVVTPIIQTDTRLVREHPYVDEPPLPCPIVAYGGDEDPTVSREELEAWRAQTSASFELRLFQGGHMYLHPGSDAFFTRLAEDLLGAGAGAS